MKDVMEFRFRDLVQGDIEGIECRSREACLAAAQEGKRLCVVLDEGDVRTSPHEAKIIDVRFSRIPIQFAHVAVIRARDGKEYVLKDPFGMKC